MKGGYVKKTLGVVGRGHSIERTDGIGGPCSPRVLRFVLLRMRFQIGTLTPNYD